MKRFVFFFFVILCSFVIEGTFVHLPGASLRVDFVWLLALYTGFFVDIIPGGIFVFLIGLSQEALGAPSHGEILLSYLIVYFFLRVTWRQLSFEGGLAQVIWVFLLTLVQRAIEEGFSAWNGYAPVFDPVLLIPAACFQGAVSLLLFPFLKTPLLAIRSLFKSRRRRYLTLSREW